MIVQKELPLEEIVKERFGIHRGIASKENPENSLEAIKAAVECEPPFVEFDVVLVDGEVRTGHPPQEPMEKLEEVLPLFERKKPYPKIDIKLKKGEPYPPIIDRTVKIINLLRKDFTLINIGGRGTGIGRDFFMQVEKYLATKTRDNLKIRLNIDLARYRPARGEIDEGIKEHVRSLGNFIYSVSPELFVKDIDEVAQFAQEYRIPYIVFWRSCPNVPKGSRETIRAALALEDRYPVKVFFDINPTFIKGFDWNPSSSG